MRVTNRMMVDGMIRNIHKSLTRLDKKYDELATGHQFRYPSDNPVGVTQAMRLKTSIAETKQYVKNADDAILWMESTDAAIGEFGTVVHRLKELAVAGANDTLPQESRAALADEVNQLREHLFMLSNSEQEGRYLFGGTRTNLPPYEKQVGGTITYLGNNQEIQTELGIGVTMGINATGSQVFDDVFDFLEQFETDLRDSNYNSINTAIGNLEDYNDNLLKYRAEIGAKVNRMEMNKTRLEGLQLNYEKILSSVQDVDIAQAVMELQIQEAIQQAALSTGARIIQPTLIDYIR